MARNQVGEGRSENRADELRQTVIFRISSTLFKLSQVPQKVLLRWLAALKAVGMEGREVEPVELGHSLLFIIPGSLDLLSLDKSSTPKPQNPMR